MAGWRGKRILVTGAGGFIGSHLTERLVGLGAEVTAYLRYNSGAAVGALRHLPDDVRAQIRIVFGDLRDADHVRDTVMGKDLVFHLGALIAIPYSYQAPRQYVDTNVIGTLNVLQAARLAETPRIVHTSTSEVYGTPRYVPIDEAHPLQGQSPYSATKIAADKLAESFFLSFQLPVATIRPFNTYGPRQSLRAVLPTIIRQALRGERVYLGSTDPVRDLNFVGDTVDAFLAIADSDAAVGRVLNIGTGQGLSVKEMVQAAGDVLGKKLTIITDQERVRPAGSEVERLIANASQAKTLLGWTPATPFATGLRTTIDWFSREPADVADHSYVV
jgi:NAD dependent epimerase/dehydratase